MLSIERIFVCLAVAAVSVLAAPASAQDPAAVLLPTVAFHGDPVGNDLFEALQAAPLLAHLSKEAPGSPVQLRIFHSVHPSNMDAKNFFSGLLSVGTLGLAPIVMTGEHTLHYEIYVNGKRLVRYEYSAKLSRNEHLRNKSADATHGLGEDGQAWAKSTVALFINDLSHDGAVRALNDEYLLYFGGTMAAPAATAQP